jgi:hypothetical protein
MFHVELYAINKKEQYSYNYCRTGNIRAAWNVRYIRGHGRPRILGAREMSATKGGHISDPVRDQY